MYAGWIERRESSFENSFLPRRCGLSQSMRPERLAAFSRRCISVCVCVWARRPVGFAISALARPPPPPRLLRKFSSRKRPWLTSPGPIIDQLRAPPPQQQCVCMQPSIARRFILNALRERARMSACTLVVACRKSVRDAVYYLCESREPRLYSAR